MKQETNNQKEVLQYEKIISSDLNNAASIIHSDVKRKGFWDNSRETGTLLMLCVSELSEALEADIKGWKADLGGFESDISEGEAFVSAFETYIKDSFEDEIADAVIRIFDLCGAKGIDIEKHVNLKLRYNRTRGKKHGKAY